MKEIIINGGVAIVDADDFDKVNRWKWQISRNGYACRNHWNSSLKKYEKMYMHRFIRQTKPGYDTDHVNRNRLDNRKANLRETTRSLNNHNSSEPKNNTSGKKGVSFFKPANLWRAYIGGGKNRKELGYFRSKSGAIKARLLAEKNI